MKVTADTNVLVRAVVRDHPVQYRAVNKLLREASVIAITLPTLCEFAWILRATYSFTAPDIARAIRALLETSAVALNRPAVEAGLLFLNSGGDFADGVIAFEGKWLGGEIFVSFDRKTVTLLTAQGIEARLLA